MDFRRYGIPPESQVHIDGEFLRSVTERLNSSLHAGYYLPKGTRHELEDVYRRTLTHAHETVVDQQGVPEAERREISEQTLSNLGRLGFIDTLGIASLRGSRDRKGPDVVEYERRMYFRLFRRLMPEE